MALSEQTWHSQMVVGGDACFPTALRQKCMWLPYEDHRVIFLRMEPNLITQDWEGETATLSWPHCFEIKPCLKTWCTGFLLKKLNLGFLWSVLLFAVDSILDTDISSTTSWRDMDHLNWSAECYQVTSNTFKAKCSGLGCETHILKWRVWKEITCK